MVESKSKACSVCFSHIYSAITKNHRTEKQEERGDPRPQRPHGSWETETVFSVPRGHEDCRTERRTVTAKDTEDH